MFERILVPLDGSNLSERALPVAVRLARATQGQIHLLRSTLGMWLPLPATEPIYAGPYGVYDWLPNNEILEDIEAEAREYLVSFSHSYGVPGVLWDNYVVASDPAGAIITHAEQKAIGLIVMSSHGHSGLERWALGSVTERVLHRAPCPVLVVRDEAPVRHILIPLDGSILSEQALEPALEIAHLLGARVTMLRVCQHERPDTGAINELNDIEPGLGETFLDREQSAAGYLQQLRARYSHLEPRPELVVTHGHPALSIMDFAASQEVDLIAMATHGRSGLRRWIYGSVTEKVLRSSGKSMLIVRPPL
jgi:nucleotide-binding universal stress UspA family protein